jgi:hypothetical protein
VDDPPVPRRMRARMLATTISGFAVGAKAGKRA